MGLRSFLKSLFGLEEPVQENKKIEIKRYTPAPIVPAPVRKPVSYKDDYKPRYQTPRTSVGSTYRDTSRSTTTDDGTTNLLLMGAILSQNNDTPAPAHSHSHSEPSHTHYSDPAPSYTPSYSAPSHDSSYSSGGSSYDSGSSSSSSDCGNSSGGCDCG